MLACGVDLLEIGDYFGLPLIDRILDEHLAVTEDRVHGRA